MRSAFSALRRAPPAPLPPQPVAEPTVAFEPFTLHYESCNARAAPLASAFSIVDSNPQRTTICLDTMTLASAAQEQGNGAHSRAVTILLRIAAQPGHRVLSIDFAGTLCGTLLGAAAKRGQPLPAGMRAANFASIEASIHAPDRSELDERRRWYQGQIASDRRFALSVDNIRARRQLILQLNADMYVEAGAMPSYAALQLLQPLLTVRSAPMPSLVERRSPASLLRRALAARAEERRSPH